MTRLRTAVRRMTFFIIDFTPQKLLIQSYPGRQEETEPIEYADGRPFNHTRSPTEFRIFDFYANTVILKRKLFFSAVCGLSF
jgi:hypothetical protein